MKCDVEHQSMPICNFLIIVDLPFAYLEFGCQIMKIFYQINYEYLYHNHKWAKLFQIAH